MAFSKASLIASFGISSFSLAPHKLISTGQGGLLTTNNSKYAKTIRRLKDFGRDKGGNDIHNYFGINSKFTELQAIVGLSQMENIQWRIKRKKTIAQSYWYYLHDIPEVGLIKNHKHYLPWFIDIYVDKRDALSYYLRKEGIGTRKMYPPMHKQKCYEWQNKNKLPITEKTSREGLWLPSSLNLTDEQIKYVCQKIRKFYNV